MPRPALPGALLLALVAACGGDRPAPSERPDDAPAAVEEAPPADAQEARADEPRTVAAPGWRIRLDPWGDPGRFVMTPLAEGAGIRVETGPPGIAWRPGDLTGDGAFRLEATFTQVGSPPGFLEAYGLIVGGQDLGGPNLSYTYVLIRGTGEYLVKQWRGETTRVLVDWTPHEALRPVADGVDPENTLAVEGDPDETRFLANGALLHAMPSDQAWPIGVAGIRVNRDLALELTGWSLEPLDRAEPEAPLP